MSLRNTRIKTPNQKILKIICKNGTWYKLKKLIHTPNKGTVNTGLFMSFYGNLNF